MGSRHATKQTVFEENTQKWLAQTLSRTPFDQKKVLEMVKDSKTMALNDFGNKYKGTDPILLKLVYLMNASTEKKETSQGPTLSINENSRGAIEKFLSKYKQKKQEKLDTVYALDIGGKTYKIATANMPVVFVESLFNYTSQLKKDLKTGEQIQLVSVKDEFGHVSKPKIEDFIRDILAAQKTREELKIKKAT